MYLILRILFFMLFGSKLCFLNGCIFYKELDAEGYYTKCRTMEFNLSDSIFLNEYSKWNCIASKHTEKTGLIDSLEINKKNIKLYLNEKLIVEETVLQDIDVDENYNYDIICFYAEKSVFKYYYTVHYLDSTDLVLSIFNYKEKWKKAAWFHFSKNNTLN